MPADRSRSAINLDISTLAKPIPKLSTALDKRRAAASSSAKAFTACLPKLITAFVPKAIPRPPAKDLTLFISFAVAVSACLNAFLPVNSAAISILTDGSTAISYTPQPY